MIFDHNPQPPAPPTDAEIIAALEQARRLLSLQHSLAKGTAKAIIDGRLCLCTVAAITAVSRTTQIRDEALKAAAYALPLRWYGHGDEWGAQRLIRRYNDARETPVEDAKTLLARAKSCVGMRGAA